VSPSTARRLAGASLTWVALLTSLGACAAPTTPRWIDDGVHAVDGYWILTERTCHLASSDACVTAVRVAVSALDIDPTTIVKTATAGLPRSWVRSDGRVVGILPNSTGPQLFAVLDLADGSRRVIAVSCAGIPNPEGSMGCGATPLETYVVGHEPID
jgi:hypothetical protein